MIKAVIFDFDGVIVESADIKTNAFKRLFEREYPDRTGEIVAYHSRNMGISRFVKFHHIYEKILKRPLSEDKKKELGEKFSVLVFEEVIKAPFVPGSMEFLAENGKKYSFFIASGTPEGELLDILRRRGLDRLFKEAHGAPEEKHEIISVILKRHSLDKNEVVFIGDAESDHSASEDAGVAFIARLTPENNRKLEGCRWKIRDLMELNGVLAKIERQFQE